MAVAFPPTGGPNVPTLLVPGNTQLSMIQGGTQTTDSTTGMPYSPMMVQLLPSGAANPVTNGQATAANSLPVAFPSDQFTATEVTVLASAARTTTQTQGDQTTPTGIRGIRVVLDMTTAGTGSVTLEIDGKDSLSGKYYALLTGAAVTTDSTNVYTVYPSNTVAANVSASTALPKIWRVKVTANNANSATYSVGACLLP
jgi:hypothetical protein